MDWDGDGFVVGLQGMQGGRHKNSKKEGPVVIIGIGELAALAPEVHVFKGQMYVYLNTYQGSNGELGGVEKVKALGANGVMSGSRVRVVWMEVGGGVVRARVVSSVVVKVVLIG
ncbi:hypothetical protein Tco_1274041 [Tanacetum coccineum]